MSAKNSKRGFSLVELVIVIVILGIIAAIAIPRISSGSKNAGESALKANLATLRNAIDWYYTEHHNTFPGVKTDGSNAASSSGAFISQLSKYSNSAGVISNDKDSAFPYGPYIRGDFPNVAVGANAGKNTISIKIDQKPCSADDSTAWMYNINTGEIIVNSTDTGNDGVAYGSY